MTVRQLLSIIQSGVHEWEQGYDMPVVMFDGEKDCHLANVEYEDGKLVFIFDTKSPIKLIP